MTAIAMLTEDQVRSIVREEAKAIINAMKELLDNAEPYHYTQKQVAEKLGITPATVCNRVKSGRIRLDSEGKITREELKRLLSVRKA
jgi:DNA-binding Lrp family transcriptional regulator